MLGLVSTWMGVHLGKQGALSFTFSVWADFEFISHLVVLIWMQGVHVQNPCVLNELWLLCSSVNHLIEVAPFR